jgi:hypothetical protein
VHLLTISLTSSPTSPRPPLLAHHRYATRARDIKNAPVVNNDPADAMVQQYKEQVNK